MKNKILKFIKSTYGIIIILFIFWMIFFDSNSLIIHNELNNDIKELNEQIVNLKKEQSAAKESFSNEVSKVIEQTNKLSIDAYSFWGESKVYTKKRKGNLRRRKLRAPLRYGHSGLNFLKRAEIGSPAPAIGAGHLVVLSHQASTARYHHAELHWAALPPSQHTPHRVRNVYASRPPSQSQWY